MSLIRVRRERRDEFHGPHRPPRLWKLLLGLAVVTYLFWYLSGC
jgi:hypothetical protein